MKVFIIYDGEGVAPELHHKLAITLPGKWLALSVDKVKEAFVGAYNKKYPDNKLDEDEFVLSVKETSPFVNREFKLLGTTDTPAASFEDKGEIRLVPRPAARAPGTTASGKLRCKNYGCQCEYDECDNTETSCRHHVAHPIFHDTRKWWSCCEGIKVYSFDEMLSIPGCMVGRHCNLPPAAEVARQEDIKAANDKVLNLHLNSAKPTEEGKAPPPKQDFAPSAPPKPKARPKLPEGYARCKHYGCQADYLISGNVGNVCTHHLAAPVFHEGGKKWPCCGVTKYDFDDFIAVPGCACGPHEPVEYDQ